MIAMIKEVEGNLVVRRAGGDTNAADDRVTDDSLCTPITRIDIVSGRRSTNLATAESAVTIQMDP